jgi:Trichothecene 3-O-acetyltransferase-like N-terminal domain
MANINFEALKESKFKYSALPPSLFAPEPTDKSPVMTIQATHIAGGLVLTFNMHHVIMDAECCGNFVRTWAKHVSALSEGREVLDDSATACASWVNASKFSTDRAFSQFQAYQVAPHRPYEVYTSQNHGGVHLRGV